MEFLNTLLYLTENLELLAAVSVIFIGFIIAGYWFLFLRSTAVPEWVTKYRRRFKELETKTIEKKYKVMEYDKLLESIFKEKYNIGEGLGSILKKKSKKFTKTTLNEIWEAHKLRNKIVHDSNYTPEQSELNHSIIVLKRIIKDVLSI